MSTPFTVVTSQLGHVTGGANDPSQIAGIPHSRAAFEMIPGLRSTDGYCDREGDLATRRRNYVQAQQGQRLANAR